jgi:hypothetical protein
LRTWLNAGHLFRASDRVGQALSQVRNRLAPTASAPQLMSPFKILER